MIIGVPCEIKNREYRVGLTPSHAAHYIECGHKVYVQTNAGVGSGYSDLEYENVGCQILKSIEEIYEISDMIIKVKEPLKQEYPLMREGQIIYTYFHLAADYELTKAVLDRKIIAIAYETITDKFGGLPCLKPMSEIAGRLAIQEGAKYLEKTYGGSGILLGGVPGVLPGNVVIIGGAGTVGSNACAIAVGMHANVTLVDISIDGLVAMDKYYQGRVRTLYYTDENLKSVLKDADLVVSCVLLPGAKAPKLIKKEHLKIMKNGSVIVDVAIDQGGSTETSHVTTHDNPTYIVDGVIHYCVGNMPGVVARTSTNALNNSTLEYGLKIANLGYQKALRNNPSLLNGLNAINGILTCKPVAEAFNIPYTEAKKVI